MQARRFEYEAHKPRSSEPPAGLNVKFGATKPRVKASRLFSPLQSLDLADVGDRTQASLRISPDKPDKPTPPWPCIPGVRLHAPQPVSSQPLLPNFALCAKASRQRKPVNPKNCRRSCCRKVQSLKNRPPHHEQKPGSGEQSSRTFNC